MKGVAVYSSIVVYAIAAAIALADPKDLTRPADVDEKLWKLLVEIDARADRIADLKADYKQEKFTPLLKKPLVSTGGVLIKGSAALWNTTSPEPTVMRIDDKEVRLLYPKQKVLEIYTTDQRISSLAASPFPRLAVLKRYFNFKRIPVRNFMPDGNEDSQIALRMQPIEPELKKYIDEVVVVLEVSSAFVTRAQTTDADGDRLILTFSNVRINSGLQDKDMELKIPAGTAITRPLEGSRNSDTVQGQAK